MLSALLRFGTDGVRGVANAELTPELVLSLGRAAARAMGPGPWVVGRDTRISGPLLQAALSAGLASEGASVVDLGVLPTPGVAHLCSSRAVPGAMVSASHNPFADNGIKFFMAGGRKLTDAVEDDVERELTAVGEAAPTKVASDVGRLSTDDGSGADDYQSHLANALEGRTLDGLRVVLDCANGAASAVAGEVFRRAGADVLVLHAQPDGTNINHGCGSTHPESLQAAVGDADLGLAFDGDADRVLAVGADGSLVDGDAILALLAPDLRGRARLADDTVVVTVMSNLGLRLALAEQGITVVETPVGDRYVLEALEAGGYSLGGEQSGHVILRDLASTGDGLLTGLLLADLVARSDGVPLHDLAARAMTRLPQVLRNVSVAGGGRSAGDVAADDGVQSVASQVAAALGDRGRVLLRPSGTEPMVRVMVEAPTAEVAESAAARLVDAVAAAAAAGNGPS